MGTDTFQVYLESQARIIPSPAFFAIRQPDSDIKGKKYVEKDCICMV